MRRPWTLVVLVIMAVVPAPAQVMVDRVVAVVNDRVITLSDWRTQESYEAMLQGRPPDQVQLSDASLTRLMDRVLVLQQFKILNFEGITPEELQKQMTEVRSQIPGAQSDAGWQELLSQYGLTRDQVRRVVAEQVDFLRFIEARFRPSVQVPDADVQSYYANEFLPQLARKGIASSKAPPLSEVRGKIVHILSEGYIDEMLDSWLQNLRSRGNVHRVAPITAEAAPEGPKP